MVLMVLRLCIKKIYDKQKIVAYKKNWDDLFDWLKNIRCCFFAFILHFPKKYVANHETSFMNSKLMMPRMKDAQ